VIVALTAWGDQHAAPNGPPIIYDHTACGSQIYQQIRCAACEQEIRNTDIGARPGLGLGEPCRKVDVGDRAVFRAEGLCSIGERAAESICRTDQALAGAVRPGHSRA
jgi:hypothetical protein